MIAEIRNCTKQPVNRKIIKKAIFETLNLLKTKGDVALSVVLVGEKKIRSLNRIWRGKDLVTDVLSFSFLEAKNRLAGGESEQGEIFICLPYAKKQARALGISADKNVAFLAVHGTIHIFGIDHERSERERKKTEKVQEKVLEVLRI